MTTTDHWYSDEQMEFFDKLERLSYYDREPADDEFRELVAEIQDEFTEMKRGAIREGLERHGPLTAADVLKFGAAIGNDFPNVQKGCEVFASVVVIETTENAPKN